MTNKKTKKTKAKKAFSVIEVVMAVFVISIGLLGILTLMSNSLSTMFVSRDQIIASQLAQEGAELIKYIRDDNVAAGDDEFEGLQINTDSDNCKIEHNLNINSWKTSDGSVCSDSFVDDDYVLYRNFSGMFSHGSGGGAVATKFRRRISISGDLNRLEIDSIVSWNGAIPEKSNCSAGNKCAYVSSAIVRQN